MNMQVKLDETNRITMYGGTIEDSVELELSDEDIAILESYFNTYKCYWTENHVEIGEPVSYVLTEEEELEQKRADRIPLLLAFDKWEKAVLRGRETDSIDIMNWYQSLLDLKDDAFIQIPDRVQYYL